MKTKLLVYLLIMLFVSCAPVKKLQTTDIKEAVKAETDVTKKVDEKEVLKVTGKTVNATDKKNVTAEVKTKTTETKVVNYDTGKPIDKTTGKPPVKDETTTTSTETTQKDDVSTDNSTSRNTVEIEYKRVMQAKMDSMQKVNALLLSKSETKETPVSNWWKWFLLGLGIPPLAWVIVRFKWYNVLSFLWR